MINQTLQQVRQGKLNPLEAVDLVDQEINGITAAIWNPGAGNYKIKNHTQILTIPTRGANKKQRLRLQELVTLAYQKAQQNNSLTPGEVHISKECSSKHHKQVFENYLNKLLQDYQN